MSYGHRWVSIQWQKDCWFNSLYRIITKKKNTSKLNISGTSWEEFMSDWWVPWCMTLNQYYKGGNLITRQSVQLQKKKKKFALHVILKRCFSSLLCFLIYIKTNKYTWWNLIWYAVIIKLENPVIRLGLRYAPYAHQMKLWRIGLSLCAFSMCNGLS